MNLDQKCASFDSEERMKMKDYINNNTMPRLDAHLALYSLINKYNALLEDMKLCKSGLAKEIIQKKLEEIAASVKKFYVIDTRLLK